MKAKKNSSKTELGILEIDVTVDCSHWSSALSEPVASAKKACEAVFQNVKTGSSNKAAEVSILLTNDLMVRSLNNEYRNQDKSTNVLSFPTDTKAMPITNFPILLGDIIVAFETSYNEAIIENKSLSDHLCHLIVHGMLHLLGFDHQVSSDADAMEDIEISVLHKLNVANPYEIRMSKDSVSL